MKSCEKNEWAKLFLKISVSYVLSWRSLEEYQLWLDITRDGHRSVLFAHEVIFQKHLSGLETLLSSWDLLWLGNFCHNWYIWVFKGFLHAYGWNYGSEFNDLDSSSCFPKLQKWKYVIKSDFCVLSCLWLLEFKIRKKSNHDKIQPQSFRDSNSRGTSIQSPSFQYSGFVTIFINP